MLHDANPLLALATLLVAGVGAGALVRRIRLPSVTGQILAGVILGPAVANVFSHDSVRGLTPITHFALGLMAVAVGSHLNVRRLRNAFRRLTILLALEVVLTPVLVFFAATVFGASWQLAVLLATISISTAPATVLALVKESRAKGVFVKTLVAATALNNIACITLFEVAHTSVALATTGGGAGWALVLAPLREIGQSLLLGGGMGGLLVITTRHVVRTDRLTTFSMIAILLTTGLADHLGVSPLLSCLFLGVVLANLTPDKEEIGHGAFENFETAIYAVFFTLAGLELDFGYLAGAAGLAAAVFAARAVGKLSAGFLAMRWAGATDRIRRWFGAALLPQAGLAVGLMLLVTEDKTFPEDLRLVLLAVVLSVVLLNEIVGPVTARIAISQSGEAGRDRPRVIDFIHEENIVTDMVADTPEDAIRQLADLLVRTNNLKLDKEQLIEQLLDAEREMSSCLGEGLMIPHVHAEGIDSLYGALGISSDGLGFDADDGPVHCVVLLVTPLEQRIRHLEVLAALARAIGSDRGIQQQLYHCHTPAHAYELLHAEESEDFNHFLED